MSDFKGTPGPWDYWSGYNPYDKIDAQVTAEGGDIVIASYNHLISAGEANAKLIAAAPDLLEAAQLVSAALAKFIGPFDIEFRALEKMRQAIAKATE